MSRTGMAAETLLIAYDPAHGRRPDIQRLGAAARSVGLLELLHDGLLEDLGDTVRSVGTKPSSRTAGALWEDCRTGVTWRRAVGRGARDLVHHAEAELADAGLVHRTERGIGPLRSRSARPTAAGRERAASVRARVIEEASAEPTAAAVVVSLHTLGLRQVLDDGSSVDRDTLTGLLPSGLVRALERTALDRRVLLTG